METSFEYRQVRYASMLAWQYGIQVSWLSSYQYEWLKGMTD